MAARTTKVYHLFLILSAVNLLAFYLFAGHSVFDTPNELKGFFGDGELNYFFSISALLLMVWLRYYIVRRRINSSRLIWLHLASVFFTVFILPWVLLKTQKPMPRRYLNFNSGFDLPRFFGNMTWIFVIVLVLILASQTFLFVNLRPKIKITNKDM